MERQQHFLASVIEKATDSGMLMNPVKLREVASTLLGSVRADAGLDTEQLLELARALREFDSGSSEFVSVPVANPDYRVAQLGSTVRWDRRRAEQLFGALRDDRPLTEHPRKRGGKRTASALPAAVVRIPPEAVQVQVDNGTRRQGMAGRVERALRATGFVTTGEPGDSGRDDVTRTSIAYDPQWNRSVRTLAKALPGARLVAEPGRGPVMGVTVGERHHGVRKVRAESAAEETPSGETGASGGKEQASCA
jgi:LytR cell envelope-related transcriptional attenuator